MSKLTDLFEVLGRINMAKKQRTMPTPSPLVPEDNEETTPEVDYSMLYEKPTDTPQLSPEDLDAQMLKDREEKLNGYIDAIYGTPYKLGAKRPGKEIDCSGYVKYLANSMGIDLSDGTYKQKAETDDITINNDPRDVSGLRIGDIFYMEGAGGPGTRHVGMVCGFDKITGRPIVTHASSGIDKKTGKSKGTTRDTIEDDKWWGFKYMKSWRRLRPWAVQQ